MDIMWRFWWKTYEDAIIEGCAESDEMESLNVMFVKALWLFEKAMEYKGFPISAPPSEKKKACTVSVSFSIWFPSDEDANSFLHFLEKLEHI